LDKFETKITMRVKSVVFFIFYLVFVAKVYSQTYEKLPHTVDGTVNVSVTRGDTLILGGNFRHHGIFTGGAATFMKDSHIPNASFPILRGDVYASVSDGAGGWYISGLYLKGGESGQTIERVEHILADNTFDPDFSIIVKESSGVGYAINKMEVHNNKLYVMGHFTKIGDKAIVTPNFSTSS
jgi:galactose-1-phosphate uridylyltransferase